MLGLLSAYAMLGEVSFTFGISFAFDISSLLVANADSDVRLFMLFVCLCNCLRWF